mmetsp:Transcript_24525/g.80377  ORF Transcript_24525/g.80377 Transcript_24525/m.80377 type:complete len:108 (+) Transcript_24525:318-641(+)
MTYMRQRLSNSSVFLMEFFRDYDSTKRGYISTHDMLRGLDGCRCFQDMSRGEKGLVVRFFRFESSCSRRRTNGCRAAKTGRSSSKIRRSTMLSSVKSCSPPTTLGFR